MWEGLNNAAAMVAPPLLFFLLPTNVLGNIVDAIKGEMEIDEDSSDEEPAG